MADKVYAEGLYANAPREGAPDFVVGSMAIQQDRFIEWLAGQEADEKGYVRLNVTTQKADASKWSVSLDTWKPKQQESAPQDDGEALPY